MLVFHSASSVARGVLLNSVIFLRRKYSVQLEAGRPMSVTLGKTGDGCGGWNFVKEMARKVELLSLVTSIGWHSIVGVP